MSGLRPFTHHPDRRRNPHDLARRLASDALLEPLDDLDAAWLEDHLASCQPCAITAAGFAADVALLEGLRAASPPVPRDLGARVALALDDASRRAARRRPPRFTVQGTASVRRRSAGSAWRGGALAGLVVAGLVAILVLPLGVLPEATPAPPAAASPRPAATPLEVTTQPVAWVRRATDGRYVISSAAVDRVCPGLDASSCGTLDGSARTLAALDVRPSSLLLPRDGGPAVVVGDGSVYAITVLSDEVVTSPRPDPSPIPTDEPAPSPTAPEASATPPTDSPAPSDDPASPAPDPSGDPTPDPAATSEPSATPASPSPSEPVGSPDPSSEPEPATPLPTLEPATPAPTAAAALAIAENVVIVGSPPAYSPDGRWVAFSARPASGEHGPDIYAWRVGDPRARLITEDHGSVFSGWLGDLVLASTARQVGIGVATVDAVVPGPGADPATVEARSFTIDPANRSITELPLAAAWLPVVDPTSRLVVFWSGSLAWDAVARAWLPAAGELVVADWPALGTATEPEVEALPPAVAGGTATRFEVRFDPAGRRLAVWIADPDVPNGGRLGLVAVDADATLGAVLLADAAALPGFSLDADRLAWSTPPGRNGQGSLVTVYAWRGDDAGQVYSVPDTGDEPLVVGR